MHDRKGDGEGPSDPDEIQFLLARVHFAVFLTWKDPVEAGKF